MSTIKSSAENLTLNADGANNDIKFQSNGSEVASIDQAGTITATTFTGAGSTPSIVDGGNATAMTIDSNEKVGIGTASIDERLHVQGGDHERIQIESTVAGDAVIIHKNNANTWKAGVTASVGGYGGDGKYSIADGNDIRLAIHPTTGYVSAVQGLVFGTDTAAANALDDYEEGTWTPAASGGASNNGGSYTKVGRLVTCTGKLTFPSQSNSGHATVEGLPFTAVNDVPGFGGFFRYTDYNPKALLFHGHPNTTTFGLYEIDFGTGVSQVSWTEISGKRLDFTVVYFAA